MFESYPHSLPSKLTAISAGGVLLAGGEAVQSAAQPDKLIYATLIGTLVAGASYALTQVKRFQNQPAATTMHLTPAELKYAAQIFEQQDLIDYIDAPLTLRVTATASASEQQQTLHEILQEDLHNVMVAGN